MNVEKKHQYLKVNSLTEVVRVMTEDRVQHWVLHYRPATDVPAQRTPRVKLVERLPLPVTREFVLGFQEDFDTADSGGPEAKNANTGFLANHY